MISENKLQEICDKYQINLEKLVKNNPNILSNGEENNIKYVLEFFLNELKISANNIEKCPSILYKAVDNIKLNWQFLKKENITVSNIESCLHILSSEPVELKRTYEYIEKNYGLIYLNSNTSILRVKLERIHAIEQNFQELNPKQKLQAATSRLDIDEIEKMIEACNKNGIEITGSVFNKTADEIEKIVEVCNKNEIEITGSVFKKTAEEIEKIVEVCNKNGIEITGSIFIKKAEKLNDNITYVKEKFGSEYILPLIISKNIKQLKEVLPYLKERGYLEYVKESASILSLTLEEIKERAQFIEQSGETFVNEKGKFNSIFGMTRKNYQKKVKARNKSSYSITDVVENVTISQVDGAKDYLKSITQEKTAEKEENKKMDD